MSATAENFDLSINQEVEVAIQSYKAKGDSVFLWFPSESGLLDQEKKLARKLTKSNIETWQADMLGAYFLPALGSSVDSVNSADSAELIEQVRLKSKKAIILVGSGRGAAMAIKAARTWQLKYGQSAKLAGAILISPKLFVETPDPGKEGQLLSVVDKTNLPIVIIQPENSPWRWKMGTIIPALEKSGSHVYAWFLKNVRDRFYYRPDATIAEDLMSQRLSFFMQSSIKLLKSYKDVPRIIRGEKSTEVVNKEDGKKEKKLRIYTGNPNPQALNLDNLKGKKTNIKNLKGKVVLVNFWASWCPPCVHEMPSMQRLSELFTDKPFEILAVNMAEDKQVIEKFLQEKVKVDFPILLDKDGAALKSWKVFAFPTSYIIGKQGKIRLALFGSIDWMNADVIKKIEKLIIE